MPSDTTTITVPTALVEAVREASRDRVPPWPEHRRYGMCAAQTEALAGMLDAILSAPPAPAGVTVDAACACAIERRAVAERCAVGRCAYALREALDLPRDESGDEYATWEAALDRVRTLAGDAQPDLDAVADIAMVQLDARDKAQVDALVAEVRRLRAVRDAAIDAVRQCECRCGIDAIGECWVCRMAAAIDAAQGVPRG